MDILIDKTLIMILCGGKGERLYPLTRDRAKPSVPFLGSYRIIDFSLSNSLNSGLRKIALLTQYKSLSLERHILFGWNIFHAESGGYIISLPAQGRMGDYWYEGTADAVFQNIYTIQQANPQIVLILSGDHIYKADYRKIIKFFVQKEADAVVLAHHVSRQQATRFGVMTVDSNSRVVEFMEKPKKPHPSPFSEESSLISMGVYLFRTEVLIRALLKDAKNPKSSHDFGKDVIPGIIREFKVYAYLFEGYWEDIGTIDAYWKSNLSFLSFTPPIDMHDSSWPIRTYKPQYPPSFLRDTTIQNSLFSSGCVICGATLNHSILSPGVKIEEGAKVEDSILLEGVHVQKKTKLRKVIIDKFSLIPENFEIGFEEKRDGKNFIISKGGVRVVPKNWRAE